MKNQMGELALCAWLLLLSSSLAPLCASDDTLRSGQSLLLNQTLVSNGKTFALGFFGPGGGVNSSRRYLGIWYNMIPGPRTLVWVANRERPFTDSSVALRFSNDSNQLVVSDASGAVLWSSNATGVAPDGGNLSAVLRDTGNLEVRARPEMDVLWQSFDHPADTILPGMKLWVNKKLHVANRIVSWKDADDPSPGLFSYGIDPAAIVQMMLWKGNRKYYRNGIWDASLTRGGPMTASGYASSFTIQRDHDVSTILFTPSDTTLLQRMVIDHTGSIRLFSWNSSISNWTSLLWFGDPKPCDAYGACGPSGVCQNTGPSRPSCSCLEGHLPRAQSEWDRGDYSGGCVNRRAPTCDGEDGFRKMGNVEVPDKMVYLQDVANASGCEAACRGNCSCAAYSFASTVQSYLNKSIPRCLIWVEEMIDLVQNSANGDELHLRVPGAGTGAPDDKSKKWMLPVVLPSVLLAVILCVALFWCCCKNKAAEMIKGRWKNGKKTREVASVARLISSSGSHRQREFSGPRDLLEDDEKEGKEMDLPMFSFEAIATATDNFSDSNKLGQGGFGDVYRGVLPGGEKLVAVKRLSKSSGQGVDEFKTELVLIAKLQHRNLVRLLGCCIQGEEKILIYEYMPNKSLDYFLFDPERQTMLDWSRRFDIIEGVARGLLYLHRDSRVRVVHRDLKASNILLDAEMNPKISDFGMARIFGGNQNADSTTRVVGTFGYMPPEYAMEGLFSVKSDVYSFGVLMLEIVSGRRNNRCGLMNVNLLRHAWQLWTAGRAEELVDPCVRGCSSAMQQVLRCVQIGLLCVQDHAHDRPTMSSVVIMLGSDAGVNPVPKQPTFTVEGSPSETDSLKTERDGNHSINTVTVSIVDGR